jgi:hypothetical protein
MPDSVKEVVYVEDVQEVFQNSRELAGRLAERERRTRRSLVIMIHVQQMPFYL